ncbi:MAG: hypothetical protein Q4G46_14925 [Propionibacteriaceae bacterium]|nr:hypothetical protein [Propionibacteriaceae bacterium]
MGFLFAVAVAGIVVWAIGVTWIMAKMIRAHEALCWDLDAFERHLEDVSDQVAVIEDLLRTGHPAVRRDLRRRLHSVPSEREVPDAQGH